MQPSKRPLFLILSCLCGLWVVGCSLVLDPFAPEKGTPRPINQSGVLCFNSCKDIGYDDKFCGLRCSSQEVDIPNCATTCDYTLLQNYTKLSFRDRFSDHIRLRDAESRKQICDFTCGAEKQRVACWNSCLASSSHKWRIQECRDVICGPMPVEPLEALTSETSSPRSKP